MSAAKRRPAALPLPLGSPGGYKFPGPQADEALAHLEKRCRFGCRFCSRARAAERREARLAEFLSQSQEAADSVVREICRERMKSDSTSSQ